MSGWRTYAIVTPPNSESENRRKNVPLGLSSNSDSAADFVTNPFAYHLTPVFPGLPPMPTLCSSDFLTNPFAISLYPIYKRAIYIFIFSHKNGNQINNDHNSMCI